MWPPTATTTTGTVGLNTLKNPWTSSITPTAPNHTSTPNLVHPRAAVTTHSS
jgi:hypothetical protein